MHNDTDAHVLPCMRPLCSFLCLPAATFDISCFKRQRQRSTAASLKLHRWGQCRWRFYQVSGSDSCFQGSRCHQPLPLISQRCMDRTWSAALGLDGWVMGEAHRPCFAWAGAERPLPLSPSTSTSTQHPGMPHFDGRVSLAASITSEKFVSNLKTKK